MKTMRLFILIGGLVILALTFGFIFRLPLVLQIWPWEDGRYSYLFLGSILAAVSAAAIWIAWTGELAALPAGSLNVFVIAALTSLYFFQLSSQERANMTILALASLLMAVVSMVTFVWSRRLSLQDTRPTPGLVRISFGIFIASLFLAGAALTLRLPIFPWDLKPETSIVFGCIFLGDAFYFLYGLYRPRWGNAAGQLLSFLAYDLVLIIPFLQLMNTVKPERLLNLVVYTAVLIYSAGLAIYYLFIHPPTRLIGGNR